MDHISPMCQEEVKQEHVPIFFESSNTGLALYSCSCKISTQASELKGDRFS